MRRRCSLRDWARSFADNFDQADRPAVEEWYHDKLRRDARGQFWLWVRACAIVVFFIAMLPAAALWLLL